MTIQAQILDLLREMKTALGLSLLLITHDLGVVAETADRVAVMYAGPHRRGGAGAAIFRDPQHPYTRGLLGVDPGRRARHAAARDSRDGAASWARCRPAALHPALPVRFEPCPTAHPGHHRFRRRTGTAKCYLHGSAVEPETRPPGPSPVAASPGVAERA